MRRCTAVWQASPQRCSHTWLMLAAKATLSLVGICARKK
jgi:hypothetical protein